MARSVILFIGDIARQIEKIERYIGAMSYEEFSRDEKTQDAVFHVIQTMGEAAKNIPDDMRRRFPDVPWRTLAGVRDLLVHAYFGISIERVWHEATISIPVLKKNISAVLAELNADERK